MSASQCDAFVLPLDERRVDPPQLKVAPARIF